MDIFYQNVCLSELPLPLNNTLAFTRLCVPGFSGGYVVSEDIVNIFIGRPYYFRYGHNPSLNGNAMKMSAVDSHKLDLGISIWDT